MPTIVFRFKEDGKVYSEGQGFKGKVCETKTDEIMKALNAKATERKHKNPDYYLEEKEVGYHANRV